MQNTFNVINRVIYAVIMPVSSDKEVCFDRDLSIPCGVRRHRQNSIFSSNFKNFVTKIHKWYKRLKIIAPYEVTFCSRMHCCARK